MATRVQRKNKLKILKQKQHENREKNKREGIEKKKEKIQKKQEEQRKEYEQRREEAVRNRNQDNNKIREDKQKEKTKNNNTQKIIWDEEQYNNLNEYPTSIKEGVLVLLKDVIKTLKNNNNDDLYIKTIAESLYCIAINPKDSYYQMISLIKNNNKMKLGSNEYEYKFRYGYGCDLNNTERALLKLEMQSTLMEYVMVDGVYDSHDYGATRVIFEATYLAIYNGLKEMSISSIIYNVKYGDELESMDVKYINNGIEYDLDKNIFAHIFWNALDKLYYYFSIYKTDYSDFSQESINSLATAKDMRDKFQEREQGRNMISYNGVAMNYLSTLEDELKNLIAISFKIDKRNITFNDAINFLEKKHFNYLSQNRVLESLHQMRKIRNKAAHTGETITKFDIEMIERKLIDEQILKFIDWNLKEQRLKNIEEVDIIPIR